MENNINENQTKSEEIKIKKNTLYIGLGVLALIIAVILFFVFKKKNDPETIAGTVKKDSTTLVKDSAKITTDSAKTPINYDEYGEEGAPFSEYRVIANSLALPSGKLNFGDKVYVDDSRSNDSRKVVFLDNPYTNKNATTYEFDGNSFISDYQFDDYKKNFSLAPFSGLASGVKKILLEDNYSNGNKYTITQNADRAKSSVAFGDYDGDGLKDVAVILDNNEKQISRILIICTNSATKLPYTAFSENYTDKMRINSFRKGASVIMNSDGLVSSPQDGIIGNAEDLKIAIIYDSSLQKFKTYYQE